MRIVKRAIQINPTWRELSHSLSFDFMISFKTCIQKRLATDIVLMTFNFCTVNVTKRPSCPSLQYTRSIQAVEMVGLGIRGWRRVGVGYVRWEELDLDPTSPPGSCVLQWGPSQKFRFTAYSQSFIDRVPHSHTIVNTSNIWYMKSLTLHTISGSMEMQGVHKSANPHAGEKKTTHTSLSLYRCQFFSSRFCGMYRQA